MRQYKVIAHDVQTGEEYESFSGSRLTKREAKEWAEFSNWFEWNELKKAVNENRERHTHDLVFRVERKWPA